MHVMGQLDHAGANPCQETHDVIGDGAIDLGFPMGNAGAAVR
jgi:hypothetical protein